MSFYSIANFIIEISSNISISGSWKDFLISEFAGYQPLFSAEPMNKQPYIHQVQHATASFYGKNFFAYGNCVIFTDDKWEHCQFILNGDIDTRNEIILHILYTHLVQKHFIQVHSSLISYGKHGIMFLGPSGIGKTTQAELWNKYMGAQIINGDLVFVQQTKQEFLGWGSPWHGSSPYCENTCIPLKAMVILKQAKENTLRRITGFEMVSEVAKSIFYPMWLENGTELCLETLDALLKQVPVYELSCKPDEDPVRLLYNELVDSKLL